LKKWLFTLALLAAVMMATAACGGNSEPVFTETSDAAAKEVKVVTTNWKFDQPEYRVKKGEAFKLTFDVQEGAHGLKVEGMPGSLVAKKGEAPSKTFVAAKEGEYSVICSVSCGTGHSQMRAKIIVE